MFDIGANLCHASFDADRAEVIARARAVGVTAIVVTGSDGASIRDAAELARAYPGYLYATAGLHPHHADALDDALLALLREYAAHPEVVATGEMGLDFYRDLSPRPAQERAFALQLEVAAEIGKPVFLHQRDAHERFVPLLKEYLPRLPAAVVHCFTGSSAELHDYLELDLYIGITGWICDERRGAQLLECVRDIPLDRLLVESDAPYLLPRTLQPRPKTRRNEPMYLPAIIATIAAARGMTASTLAAQTTANTRRFFALPPAGLPVKPRT
ncbi:MAG: TatD family hydrolase [Nevskiales bacterium]